MLTIGYEKIANTWQEIDKLARLEHEEMEKGWRPYCPDWKSMIALEQGGTYKTIIARRDGVMIGYFMYMIDFDIEAEGVLITHQCAWFVIPGHFSVAARMFVWAREEWKRLGVKFVYLHNSERGRGRTLGRFFERQGAFHCSNTYVLPLRG